MTHPTSQCPEGYGPDSVLAYLCDDDDSEEQRRFAEHLESTECEACTDQLRSLTFIQDAVDTWQPRTNRAADPLWAKVDADAPPADARESYSVAAARPSWGFVLRPAWGLGLAATLMIAVAGTVWQPYLSSGTRSDGARGILESATRAISLIAPGPSRGVADESQNGRVALVIGNSAYTHAGPLRNPENDAADMAGALRRLGFEVTTVLNAGREDLTQALRMFTRGSVGADISLVFYAGHGLEVDRVNYLLPVDARLELDADVRFEAVALEDVLAATMGAALRLVILDACRNNPLARSMQRTVAYRSISQGSFAELDEALLGDEMLVAYAAAARTTAADGAGRNSPYTAALLANIEEPLEIGMVFRRVRSQVLAATNGEQRPQEFPSLLRAHYLSGSATDAPSEQVATVVEPRQLDIVALSLLAEQGDPAAQNELGERYEHGVGGLLRDYGGALRWYRQAADKGYAAAQHNLGHMYSDGLGVSKDLEEARRWTVLAADQGYADAISTIGYYYMHGEGGVGQDVEEAVRWFERAADQGSIFGLGNLATMYEDGLGVQQDYAEAARLYDLAMTSDNNGRAEVRALSYAQVSLGMMYEDGRGVARDLARAARLYEEAAELGDIDAQVMAGDRYEQGRGVPLDSAEAVRWYRLAAEQGDGEAQNKIGEMYQSGLGVPQQDSAEAARWYRLAAEQGDVFAQTKLGLLYASDGLYALDGAPDYAEATRWLRRAAEQGYGRAQKQLRRLEVIMTRPNVRFEAVEGSTPREECSEQLGVLTVLPPLTRLLTYTDRGVWDGSCVTVNSQDGESARYYGFALDRAGLVSINLMSEDADAWLALWTGGGGGDDQLEVDDDGGEGVNARIERLLDDGEYTIEASTLVGGMSGSFMLRVEVRDR